MKSKIVKITGISIAVLISVFFILAIPEPTPVIPAAEPTSIAKPFAWNQDVFWDSLESEFFAAMKAGCVIIMYRADYNLFLLEKLIEQIETRQIEPEATELRQIENQIFILGPLVAECDGKVPRYLHLIARMRTALKRQSEKWDINDRLTRETLYRLLYGGRAAAEEVILQIHAIRRPPALQIDNDEHSSTPASNFLGVKIHSGDIFVSRGGAPTSALIARGNDFPGNFSHIALAFVDSSTKSLKIIESHIERGVEISTPEDYFQDKKLRIMVLRLRSNLPSLVEDPLLPHRAAAAMLNRVKSEHIPYDFSMDYNDTTKIFCSEVASTAYRKFGINLWLGLSHISAPGLRRWLADFGVRHFETQEPSDLEYDPQLCVVAEWRDPETLFKDHIDNAATEAMLEMAERGFVLDYKWYMLPAARILKAYCWTLNLFHKEGQIPEGMSAASALKHEFYAALHAKVVDDVQRQVNIYHRYRRINPPSWELLRMARTSLQTQISY
ncbi:MAG: hypothetical protein QME58_13755 [Bacteroidota bacterium]|nr:hypothetical protein [Bacteroidota bacterium]